MRSSHTRKSKGCKLIRDTGNQAGFSLAAQDPKHDSGHPPTSRPAGFLGHACTRMRLVLMPGSNAERTVWKWQISVGSYSACMLLAQDCSWYN